MSDIIIFIVLDLLLIALGSFWLAFIIRRRRAQSAFHLRLITILTSTLPARDLLERVSLEVQRVTGAAHASFFVYKPDGHFVSSGTKGHLRPTKHDCDMLEKYFERAGSAIVHTRDLTEDIDIRKMLKSYRIEITLPLVRGNDVIGFFFMGKKQGGHFNLYDVDSVTAIRAELAIAVQNAVSLEAIKELNAHLQQRVDSATDELRVSNEKLRGLDAAKDEFLSMASHQLRTPLTSVKGYISMVLEGDGGKVTKVQKQLLSEAFTSSERMVHLINDFLSVSRVQTGKFMIEKHDVDLVKVLRQETSALKTTAESRKLRIKTEFPSTPLVMSLDEGKIRQVIMNFIDNALYYSKPDTDIIVRLEATDGRVTVEVIDSGIGVPAAQQAKLFTKFFRADNARTQRPDGTGVGLYLAKKVIDGHKGSLIFRSTEGQGSTFGFSLPRK